MDDETILSEEIRPQMQVDLADDGQVDYHRIDVSTEDIRLDRCQVFLYMIQADIGVKRQIS